MALSGTASDRSWRQVRDVEVVLRNIDHVEGVAVGLDGTLWAGGEAGQVYMLRPGHAVREVASLPGRTLGVALDASGNAYWCDETEPGVYRVSPEGEVATYSKGPADRPFRVPNYPAFLPNGTLLVSDSGGWDEDNGAIVAIRPDGDARVLTTAPRSFPNGLCVTADGTTVYVCETTASKVSKITLDSHGGVTGYDDLVHLPGALPDGLALDVEDRLYIACFLPDAIYALKPDGELETVILDERRYLLNAPTNIAFGGPELRHLYFANLGDRHVGRIELDVAGVRPHMPTFPAAI